MTIQVFIDDELIGSITTTSVAKVDTTHIKNILTQMVNLPIFINFWDEFFEHDPSHVIKPFLSKFAKSAAWRRESKQKAEHPFYPTGSIERIFTQTVIDEDNFRFEVFSDSTDTKILGIQIVTD